MQDANVSKICHVVINFFRQTATQIGQSVKFTQRQSKLTSRVFAEVLVMGFLSASDISLEGLCKLIKKRGVKITRQGLHERFTPQSTELMKQLFLESHQQFRIEKGAVIDLLKPFSTVQLLDSTGISLPPILEKIYPGFGGGASAAALKIQVMFDYVNGQVESATITKARQNDQSFTEHLSHLQKGGLYLQDLGYFSIDSFHAIEAAEAYFISRYLSQTKIYDEQNQELDILKELSRAGLFFSKKIKMGKQNPVAVRLVGHRLPDAEVEKRLRKIYKEAKKKGRTPKYETLELAKWSICVTNVPSEMLKDSEIYLVYSLRWQIELFFKLCKSEAGLDKIKGKKPERILCEIYAKLICVVILLYSCFPERWQQNQELSFFKAYKHLRSSFADFFRALSSPYRLFKFFKEFFEDLRLFALKEKPRKKRKATYQKMMNATGQEILA
jgi:Transposase DDE domain